MKPASFSAVMQSNAPLLAVVLVGFGVVFLVDVNTSVGYAAWILYLVPVGLALLQPWGPLPLWGAALATVLIGAGLLLSPPGMDMHVALFNRSAAVLACWTLGYLVWRTLQLRAQASRLQWLQQGEAQVSSALVGEQSVAWVAEAALKALCPLVRAETGVVYQLGVATDGAEASWLLGGAHGVDAASLPLNLPVRHGLLGLVHQAPALRLLTDVGDSHVAVATALGCSAPRHVVLCPLLAEGTLIGVMELGLLRHVNTFAAEQALLERCAEPVGHALRAAVYRQQLVALLAETRNQSQQLQVQQEELRVSNEELEERNQRLQATEEELRQQSEELKALNEELTERAIALEQQKAEVVTSNTHLEATRKQLEGKALELETSGRYKSEFLANMSHELRTPLNSLLLLSGALQANDGGNLTEDQLESVAIIAKGGRDLLTLINDILDLSKIEAGKLVFQREPVDLPELVQGVAAQLRPLAEKKGLELLLQVAPGSPGVITSDGQRIEQVLKNLLSNAIKFTERGQVVLSVAPLATPVATAHGRVTQGVTLAVRDTGIGIAPGRQREVWEAFQQADGSTSRRYGGTGLGLTISRQLAQHLGGDMQLESQPGQGSTFTLALPLASPVSAQGENRMSPATSAPASALAEASAAWPAPSLALPTAAPEPVPLVAAGAGGLPSVNPLQDDREQLQPGERSMLIVEDDEGFARLVMRMVRKQGFKVLVANRGADGLALAKHFRPAGVVLDLGLPDMDGEEVLRQLKADPRTQSIPVHIASGRDKDPALLVMGAAAYLKKPVEAAQLTQVLESVAHFDPDRPRRVLVVEDHLPTQVGLKKLLSRDGTKVEVADSGAAALALLDNSSVDCLVLDLTLPDMSGLDFLKTLQAKGQALPPVVVHTGKDLSEVEYRALREYSDRIVVKGALSPERLTEEVSLFLHTMGNRMPGSALAPAPAVAASDVLAGRKVLIVDDDVRNTFALAKALRPYKLEVVLADDGQLALDKLAADPGIELVLMDIMMPVMDGYEAMRRIRADKRWADLPVIALTAKAMAEDKQKCLDAGANDYLAKPVDMDRLLAVLRIWLSRAPAGGGRG